MCFGVVRTGRSTRVRTHHAATSNPAIYPRRAPLCRRYTTNVGRTRARSRPRQNAKEVGDEQNSVVNGIGCSDVWFRAARHAYLAGARARVVGATLPWGAGPAGGRKETMENWMLIHELNGLRHQELLREVAVMRLARRVRATVSVNGGRLAMAVSLASALVIVLVRG